MTTSPQGLGTVLVTGASSGIGFATAERLIDDGFAVVNLDIAPPVKPSRARHVAIDLGDADATKATLAEIVAGHDIAAVVNNAGHAVTAPVEETTVAIMERSWRVNVLAPMLCVQAALPSMKARGSGRVVNIVSRAALGRELRTGYAGTKGNLLTMTRVWALELARHGITVNAVGPGPVRTELYDRMNPPGSERTKAIIASIPVGRAGVPDDIANAVAFFVDARSSFVTGQVLYVCGGLTIGAGPL